MGETVILTERDDPKLTDFLVSTPGATIYHTPEWRNAVTSTYAYEPHYLAYMDGGRIKAVLPLMLVRSWLTGTRLVSLPFANVSGPLGSRECFGPLIEEAIRIADGAKAKTLEMRTQADLNDIDDDRFTRVSYFVTSIVPLDSDPDVVWERLKGDVRTKVRQAARKGIEVKETSADEDLKHFYDLFVEGRLKHGVPPQPYRFFHNLWHSMKPEQRMLLIATLEGRPVGALLNLAFGDTLYGGYIGSRLEYRSYRINQSLNWKAIELGCRRGHTRFDFLRTARPSGSLREFKLRWNAHEVDLNYMYYPAVYGTAATVEETARYRLMTFVLKRSPSFVGRMLGRMIYRHLG
jgi:CelD/BcsL family acetyltransferase involved in cellulose biosynthesis